MVRLVIGLAFLVFSTLSCDAKISGRVMDGSHGVPLAGVTVTFGQDGPSVTTNASGDYHFDGVWIGKIMFAKDGYGTVSRSVDLDQASENVVLTLSGKVTYVCTTADEKGRWQIARTVFDPETKRSEITFLTDTVRWNFKPNFSPDGSRLTFFRRYAANGPCCETWLSSICVMNADGSGLHEIITGSESFNTEPYWARDGSQRISFNRMNVDDRGPHWNQVDGDPGQEERLAPWGWVNPHLADGRVLVQRGGKTFLAKPSGDGKASYSEVRRSDEHFIHKIALSRDESMIAYQKWVDRDHNMYKGGVMVFAKFDASIPAITDEVIFDDLDPTSQAWYVSISTDNRFLLFAKDGAIMQYDVASGVTTKVSADSDPYKAYPTYTTFSK